MQDSKLLNIAIVGATGAVGAELISCLEKRKFPVGTLRLFASARSAGHTLTFKNEEIVIEELRDDIEIQNLDIALFAAGSSISKHYAPLFTRHKILVIDNSSAFRMDPEVPLVVPEVNAQDAFKHNYIIANPNCSTIIATLPLPTVMPCSSVRGCKVVQIN